MELSQYTMFTLHTADMLNKYWPFMRRLTPSFPSVYSFYGVLSKADVLSLTSELQQTTNTTKLNYNKMFQIYKPNIVNAHVHVFDLLFPSIFYTTQ